LPAHYVIYLGQIVETATASPSGDTVRTPRRCRRRPKRKPCPGHLLVRRLDVPPEIDWACPSCGDSGVISARQGTAWDFTRHRVVPVQAEGPETAEVVLSEEELEELAGYVSFEARRTKSRHRQGLLESALDRIFGVLWA